MRIGRSVKGFPSWPLDHLMLIVLISLSVATSSGCHLRQWAHNRFKLGPNYSGTAADVAPHWIEADNPQVLNTPPEYPDWWHVFNDPVLNNLIETAHAQNLTLREAGWRIAQARSQRRITAGNLFPQSQQATASVIRQQIGLIAQPLLAPIPGSFERAYTDLRLGASLSWELDFWGRFRRAIEAADANLDASIHDYDAILVCLIAEVATEYTNIRTVQQRLVYARENVRIQEGSLQLAQYQADEGQANYAGVELAKTNLRSTRALIPDLEIELRQASNRLCTLLGIPTSDLVSGLPPAGIPIGPAEVAVGIPADLLRRRPDIRRSERRIAEQSASIGIAISDLYPHFTINGSINWGSEKLSNLFSGDANGGSIGPGISWDLLNYGRLVNNVELQREVFGELIANYRNTVLTANQEVEDALVAFLQRQQKLTELEASVEATGKALELVTIQYKEGESNFTGVFVMQRELVLQKEQLAQTEGEIAISLIAVYKALGGGWEIRLTGSGRPTAQSGEDVIEGTEFVPPLTPDVIPSSERLPELPAAGLGGGRPADVPRKPERRPVETQAIEQLELENARLKQLLGEAQLHIESRRNPQPPSQALPNKISPTPAFTAPRPENQAQEPTHTLFVVPPSGGSKTENTAESRLKAGLRTCV